MATELCADVGAYIRWDRWLGRYEGWLVHHHFGPSSALLLFCGGGFPTETDRRKTRYQLILTSLEDLDHIRVLVFEGRAESWSPVVTATAIFLVQAIRSRTFWDLGEGAVASAKSFAVAPRDEFGRPFSSNRELEREEVGYKSGCKGRNPVATMSSPRGARFLVDAPLQRKIGSSTGNLFLAKRRFGNP